MAAIIVTKRPYETVESETSKWNAIANPVVYKFQRQDIGFDEIDDLTPGNPIKLVVLGVDVAAIANGEANNGDPVMSSGNPVIWINFTNPAYQSGYYEFLGATYSAPNTYMDIEFLGNTDVPSQGVQTAGTWIGTGLKNAGVEIIVYNADGSFMDGVVGFVNERSFVQSLSPSGEAVFNVGTVLKAFIKADNEFDFINASWAATPHAADTISKEFYIQYRFVYDGHANSYVDDSGNTYYGMMAGRQIPSPYGCNMAEYVTFADGTPKARWLTKMAKPVMWFGWPFSVGAIVGNLGVSFFRIGIPGKLDQNTTHANNSNTIRQLTFKGLTYLTADDKLATVIIKAETGDYTVTETLEVEVRQPCINPIMLLGRNSLGGPLFWLFEINQEYSYINENGKKIKQMILSANGLSNDQWEALQDFIREGQFYNDSIEEFTADTLKTQSQVGNQVYILDQSGNKIGVTVLPQEIKTNTRRVQNFVQLTIRYPEQFLT